MHEVARELLERSKHDKVGWEETRAADAYRVLFPDVSLRISRHVGFSGEEEHDYELELTSETGRVIGSMAPDQIDPMHQVLAQIFDLAEQFVRDTGVDKALEYLKRD